MHRAAFLAAAFLLAGAALLGAQPAGEVAGNVADVPAGQAARGEPFAIPADRPMAPPDAMGSASDQPAAAPAGGPPVPPYEPLRFGIDAGAAARHRDAAGAPEYGTLWVGHWNLVHGWQDTDATLRALAAANVTPFVQLYYWGDDIHPDCFSVGCNGKTLHGWQQLAADLTRHLQQELGGAPATVVLESEFNKHQVHANEDLDGYLAQRAAELKAWYPAVTVVLGLGNWYPQAWPTWDRAAAASDAIGIQAMAGSTRDGEQKQMDLFEATLEGVEEARELFDKPLVVHDVAVSSYPEPENLQDQEAALAEFGNGFAQLREAGVEAVVYRSFLDVPDMATSNHYGEAERHWGLAWSQTGELKPAGEAWLEAVEAERTGDWT